MELTKQHLDAITKTATLVANLAEDLHEVKTDVKVIKDSVGSHTDTLDAIVKNTKDWNAEMTVMRNRMDRYELALKTVGKKLNLDLDKLLH